jgi:lipid II:glycine glycyltransferase (peptidoglycan interpeptide bridge formation enzyme)
MPSPPQSSSSLKKAVYKFAATDGRLQNFRGNSLVICEGIRFLVQNGAQELHLGRTSPKNDRLRRFKLAWGTEEERIEYFA